MEELIVVLDNIRSVLNVGAIMRTCDGAGVKEVILVGITPVPGHKKLIKTALGAEEFIDWKYFKEIKEAIEYLKNNDYKIYSVEQTPETQLYYKIEYPHKSALIFGHEITGVSNFAIEHSDATLEIPMLGKKNSLNVSTCVGILVYHIITKNLNK